MAEGEIEEGLFDLFKEEGEGAEGKTEAELLQEAKEKAGDAIEEGFKADGIDLDNIPPGGEQAEVEEGLKEGKEATKDLNKVNPAQTVDKWANPKSWGKWVAIELAKGILFGVGTVIVSETWDAIKAKSASPANNTLADAASKSSAAIQTISKIVDEWHLWLKDHYDDRAKYGSVSVQGFDILKFEIFQVAVSNIDTERDDKMIPVAAAAKTNPTKDTLLALLNEEVVFAQLAIKAATDARDNEPLMVADGLVTHYNDLQAPLQTLQGLVQKVSQLA
ncbi:hypothetical protein GGR55DRAFT_12180 [Xylaria sp. FL0064]|nr:hypothetical protein GGR55DRAFT_12180 [Xylaria sp. FL0064]